MIKLDRMAFTNSGASAQVKILDDGLGELINVWSYTPRQGHATGLMRLIAEWADTNIMTILLLARAQGHPDGGMSNDQLQHFYEKFGFRRQPEYIREIRMIRLPSQELHGP